MHACVCVEMCVCVCVCRGSHFHLQCENTPLLIHFPILSSPPFSEQGPHWTQRTHLFSTLCHASPRHCSESLLLISVANLLTFRFHQYGWGGQREDYMARSRPGERMQTEVVSVFLHSGRALTMAAVCRSVVIDQSDVVLCGMDCSRQN